MTFAVVEASSELLFKSYCQEKYLTTRFILNPNNGSVGLSLSPDLRTPFFKQ